MKTGITSFADAIEEGPNGLEVGDSLPNQSKISKSMPSWCFLLVKQEFQEHDIIEIDDYEQKVEGVKDLERNKSPHTSSNDDDV